MYGEEDPLGDKLSLNSDAGDEVSFHVGGADGPQALDSPVPLESGTEELNLTFPAGTFSDPDPPEPDPVLESIAISLADTTIAVDNTTTITVTGEFDDGSEEDVTGDAIITSNDTEVATVEDNEVVGIAGGDAQIQATLDGITASTTLTVEASVETIDLTIDDPLIATDETAGLTVTATLEDRSSADVTDDVTLSTADTDITSIEDTAVAGEGGGETTVEATTAGETAMATIGVVDQFDVDLEELNVDEEITLDATDIGVDVDEYEWNVADQSLDGETAAVTIEEADDYTVTLTVTDEDGNTAEQSQTIAVEDDDGLPGSGVVPAVVGVWVAIFALKRRS